MMWSKKIPNNFLKFIIIVQLNAIALDLDPSTEPEIVDFASEDICNAKDVVVGNIDLSLNDLQQDDPRLVQVLREKYLVPPSKKKLNIKGNGSPTVLQGQFKQPIILDEMVFKGKKKNGFFIEAGAYDGEMYSNSLYFELKHQWTGLLIEPSPRHLNQLLTKNRKSWVLGNCISTKTHPEVVLFENAGIGSGIVNEETGNRPGSPKFAGCRFDVRLQCFPLYSMLLALDNPVVDYFSLDVEGPEISILKTVPWDKVNITVVGVEINHLGQIFPGNFTDLENLMGQNGYEVLGYAEIDAFFVRKDAKIKKKKKKQQKPKN